MLLKGFRGYIVVSRKLEEFGPTVWVKRGAAESIEEVCASFCVRVCDLISGGKKGAKFPWSCDLWILRLSSDVPNCMRAGEMHVQSASGSLLQSFDLGRMLRSWSVMRFRGRYL